MQLKISSLVYQLSLIVLLTMTVISMSYAESKNLSTMESLIKQRYIPGDNELDLNNHPSLIKDEEGHVSGAEETGVILYDNDLKGICKFLEDHSISLIDLSSNSITDAGAKVLAECKSLTSIDLSDNKIGTEGAKALMQNKNITYLDLSSNKIDSASKKTLSNLNHIEKLRL